MFMDCIFFGVLSYHSVTDTLSVNVSGDDSLKLKAAVFNQNSDFHDAATKHDPFLCDESIDNNVSSINSDASNIQGQATGM